jgi:hypothetical protein
MTSALATSTTESRPKPTSVIDPARMPLPIDTCGTKRHVRGNDHKRMRHCTRKRRMLPPRYPFQDCLGFEEKSFNVIASQAVVHVPPVLASVDQPAVAQACKVAASIARRQARGQRDLASTQLADAQRIEDVQPRRVGEAPKEARPHGTARRRDHLSRHANGRRIPATAPWRLLRPFGPGYPTRPSDADAWIFPHRTTARVSGLRMSAPNGDATFDSKPGW